MEDQKQSEQKGYQQYLDSKPKSNKKKTLLITGVAAMFILIAGVSYALLAQNGNDNGAGQSQTNPEITQCGDMDCFDESFTRCEKVMYLNELDTRSGFSEEYTILGPEDDSCLVGYKSIEQIEEEQIVEEATCLVDNSKEFLLALTEALDNPEEHSCSEPGAKG